jgi:histidinol-phosphate/aromatic aminotransferase/cobyric acid decarboxylase-like protein
MIASRRGFLRSLGGCAAAGLAGQGPLEAVSRAAIFEPYRFNKDDGLIHLDSNENPYAPSTKVADAIRSSIGSANRYPRMEYRWLAGC